MPVSAKDILSEFDKKPPSKNGVSATDILSEFDVKKKDEPKGEPLPVESSAPSPGFLKDYLRFQKGISQSTSPSSQSPSSESRPPMITPEAQLKINQENEQQKTFDENRKSVAKSAEAFKIGSAADTRPEIIRDFEIESRFDASSPYTVDIENANEFQKAKIQQERNDFDNRVNNEIIGLATDPAKLAQYNAKRINDLNKEIDVQKQLIDISESSSTAPGFVPGSSSTIQDRSMANAKISALELKKYELKKSTMQVAAEQLTPKFIMDNYSPRQLGRELIRVADPEQNYLFEKAESGGTGIGGVKNAYLEKVGLELGRYSCRSRCYCYCIGYRTCFSC